MKTHHRQPPAGRQQQLGGIQRGFQLFQLGIHMNTDSLKTAGGGVFRGASIIAQRPAHHPGQLASGGQRARGDNGAGHPARLPLLAIAEQHIGNVGFGGGVDEIGGAGAILRHAHIQRAIAGKGKATLRLIQLHR